MSQPEFVFGESPDAAHPGQWRLSAVEMFNWGTFSGLHSVDVARRGHLFTGDSGSGKSTLLDAIAAVLTPPKWLKLNAAAEDGGTRDRGRTLVSYVRGAWRREQDADSGEAVATYLRGGKSVWSGIRLEFDNGLGGIVSLARLFHLPSGTNQAADLGQLHVLTSERTPLAGYAPHIEHGINLGRSRAAFKGARVEKEHSHFSPHFRRALGIQSERALQLLHRAQSAKNFGTLNQLFRRFMLDEPATFDHAKVAVEQFTNLDQAHQLVAKARDQVARLKAMRKVIERLDGAELEVAAMALLERCNGPWARRLVLELLVQAIDAAQVDLERTKDDAVRADVEFEAANTRCNDAERVVEGLGGTAIALAQERLGNCERAARSVTGAWQRMRDALKEVGVTMPTDAAGYRELRAAVEDERAALTRKEAVSQPARYAAFAAAAQAKQAVEKVEQDLEALAGRRSNIDERLLQVRAWLARELGVSEQVIPFAGELIEVPNEFADWRPAIERVLRPLAATVLVSAEYLDRVAELVDAQDLKVRLVYEDVSTGALGPKPARTERSLVNRVRVSPSPHKGWLEARLGERYDYECVSNASELVQATGRAVTMAGQVRGSGRRFEKDDRFAIDDRRRWVLGADTARKRADLEDRLAALREELSSTARTAAQAQGEYDAGRHRANRLETAITTPWEQLDRQAAQRSLDEARNALKRLEQGNAGLAVARETAEQAGKALAAAREGQSDANRRLGGAEGKLADLRQRLDQVRAAVAEDRTNHEIPDTDSPEWAHIDVELERRYRVLGRRADLVNLEDRRGKVADRLQADRRKAEDERDGAKSDFENAARAFHANHPATDLNLTGDVADRCLYLDLLSKIEGAGLPEHEKRFKELLQEQSQQLTAYMLAELRDAPTQVRSRIEPVNRSLAKSPFARGRYLRIRVDDAHGAEVKEFMRDLERASAGSWSDETADDA
ncbi:MAG: hypothetical protein LBO20_01740, partial [Bifidobacteriaceae bacterium]|nr:hypothetical protein [Bifidobacteriaceae bacterium]